MGATFDWVFPQTFEPQESWWVDGVPVPTAINETATARTLSLTFRVTSQDLLDTVRQLKPDEGKVDVLTVDDGGFSAIDRANGANSFTLTPPTARLPLRGEDTYHVNRYEETLVSQDIGEWTVDVEFIKSRNRTDSPTISETKSGAVFDWTFPQTFEERLGWAFDTRYGQIATDRVDAEFLGTGSDGVERFELVARLSFEQAHVLEAAYSRLAGGRVKQIPDAPNVMVDETTDDAVTVTVNAPESQSTVADGAYVITEWESERLNDRFQSVAFTVAAKD